MASHRIAAGHAAVLWAVTGWSRAREVGKVSCPVLLGRGGALRFRGLLAFLLGRVFGLMDEVESWVLRNGMCVHVLGNRRDQ